MFSINADIWVPVLIGTITFAGCLSVFMAGYEIGKTLGIVGKSKASTHLKKQKREVNDA